MRTASAESALSPTRAGSMRSVWVFGGGGSASLTVLWALDRYPEIFRAGVAVFPILDLARHLSEIPEADRLELSWALGPPSGWPELSVAHLATHLCRPLALFAGRDDPLSHPDELLRLEEGLKARQVPCWLSLYGGEGRTWRHKETYADYYSRVAGFFDRFLRFRAGG